MELTPKPSAFSASELAKVGAFATAYLLAHQLAFFFPDSEEVLMIIWPAGGIGLAAFLLSPYRRWPALLVSFYIAGVGADVLLANRPFLAGLGYMTGNMVESLGCALLIIRMSRKNARFDRIYEVLALIMGAIGVNAISSCIGALTAVLVKGSSFGNAWFSWYVSDGLGILIITPVIITWARIRERIPHFCFFRSIEVAGFLLFWGAAAWLTFHFSFSAVPASPHPYMLMALLAWPAFRFGQPIVSLALLLLTAIALTSVQVAADFSLLGGGRVPDKLLSMQIFLGFAASTGFLLAATYAEVIALEQVSYASREQLRVLGDNLPSGMVYQLLRGKNGARRFVYVSAGVESLAGVSAEAVLRDPSALYDLILPEDLDKLIAAERESAAAMSVFNITVRMRLKNGALRWMSLASSPRGQADGSIVWDGIQMDITERKLAEEEHLKYELQLQQNQKLESLGILAGGIAHDFNNLMGSIFGYIDIANDNATDKMVTRYLAKAMYSMDRARGLTQQLLTFAKGGAPIIKTDHLVPFIQETAQFALSGSAISCGYDVPENLWSCRFDRNQIGQAIDNIIVNAQQAMPSGGCIAVTARNISLGEKEHISLVPGRYVKVSIKDSGIGIPEEILPRIFDPFFTTKEKGHGLGLATSYSIIHRHGGVIEVESAPGQGSAFHLYLPASPASAAIPATPS